MLKEFERWEVLVQEEQRVGVLYRCLESNVLLTRILLEDGVEPYQAESRVRLDALAETWEVSWYKDLGLDQATLMRREAQGLPATSMPSFGDVLMLMRAVESPQAPVRYWRLNESDPDTHTLANQRPSEPNATIHRVGEAEACSGRSGNTMLTHRFESWADGVLVATHWVDGDNELVRTRWSATLNSYRVPGDASEAGWRSLSGLGEGTVEFMTRGFGPLA